MIVADLASTWPAAPTAAIETSGAVVATVIVVSKPCRGWVATTLIEAGELPARTCHALTAVAPFQLASTVTTPDVAWAAIAGAVIGRPLHGAR